MNGGIKITRKKRHKQEGKKIERNTCGYRGACISKDDWTKGSGFNESIKDEIEAKQNKRNHQRKTSWHLSAIQTPGGYKFAPLVASQQGRANQHEPACFGLPSPWSFPSRSGIPLHAVVQPCSYLFRHEINVPPLVPPFWTFPLVLWAAVVHWSALMPKAPRSSRKHPSTHSSSSWPPTQPAPPTSSPNITHLFGSTVSSMRAINPTNKIRPLRKVASMRSFPSWSACVSRWW